MKHDYWLLSTARDVIGHMEAERRESEDMGSNPVRRMWVRNYFAYYSPLIHPSRWDSSIIFEGMQGELTRIYTPKARTATRQLVSLVTKTRMAFQSSARTRGSDTLSEVKLANAVADQIVDTQRLDLKGSPVCEGALMLGDYFVKVAWRTDIGQPRIRDERGKVIRTGGVEISIHPPWHVNWDMSLPWDQVGHAEVKVKRNRWDLTADFPELAAAISQLPAAEDDLDLRSLGGRQINKDMIWVYEFYAKPSTALPEGRLLIYASHDTVFYDGPNIYEGGMPLEKCTPEEILSTGMGYAKLTDVLGCQEMYDATMSAIATNNSQFGVQNVCVPNGSGIQIDEIRGMNFVRYNPMQAPGGGKPEALQLTQTAPETFKFADKLEGLIDDLYYLNGAITGNLPPGVSSGTAIATLSANSLEFVTSISKAYNLVWEKTMMHAISAYKNFAKIPQEVKFEGKGGRVRYEEFRGDDLANVSSMKIETLNPLMKVLAGRLEVGEKLLSMPKEMWGPYIDILDGKPLKSIYRGETLQSDLIEQENEDLAKGEKVAVLQTDNHAKHIQGHAAEMADTENRRGSEALQGYLEHIMEHYEQLKVGTPVLQAIMETGRIPEGGMPAEPPPGPPPGGPPGGPPPGGPPASATSQGAPPEMEGSGEPQINGDIGDVAEPSSDLIEAQRTG